MKVKLLKTNCRIITAVLFLSLLLTMLGCSSAAGTYVLQRDKKVSIELQSGGKCLQRESEGSAPCTYEISGKEITFKRSNGSVFKATIENDTITDQGGDIYKKNK